MLGPGDVAIVDLEGNNGVEPVRHKGVVGVGGGAAVVTNRWCHVGREEGDDQVGAVRRKCEAGRLSGEWAGWADCGAWMPTLRADAVAHGQQV